MIPKGVPGEAYQLFEIIDILVDKWPLHFEGLQLVHGSLGALDEGIHPWDELVETNVAFELFDEIIGLFMIS